MTWILYSCVAVLFQAAFVEANRKLQLDGYRLNLWGSLFAALYLLPVIGYMYWPTNGLFYLVAFIAAASSAVGGIVQFQMAARHNGRVVAMYMPVKAFAMFALWLIVDPALVDDYFSNPEETALIGGTFIISVTSLIVMRKNDIGWRAFLIVAPIGALFAASNILTKIAFNDSRALASVLCFNLLFYIFMVLQTLPVVIARRDENKPIFDKRILPASALIGLFSLGAFIGLIGGIVNAPNPAYVSIFQMMTPALIMILHKCAGIPDNTSPYAGLGLVLGAIILIYATQVL